MIYLLALRSFSEAVLALRSPPLADEEVEPAVGLEPTTYGLQNRCSTR